MFRKILGSLPGIRRISDRIQQEYRAEMSDYRHPKVNLGRLQATLNYQSSGPLKLSDVEFRVFSQFGDDGIIQYLVQKMQIGNKTFIEFGVEDYKESNTRFLLVNNFWSGFVIDGNEKNINTLKSEQLYSFFDIKAQTGFIDSRNVNQLLESSGFGKELGLLSIDIDGNDYWVWKQMIHKAAIVVCEYNSLFGFEDSVTIPYQDNFVRGRNTPFNYYGASLAALCSLASEKGYFFIGCNSAGNNAYFISRNWEDRCPFPEVSVQDGFVFASFSEWRNENGDMAKGLHPLKPLQGLPLVNVPSGDTVYYDLEKISKSLKQAGKIRRDY
jgi:hypothetical protein